MEEKIPHGRPLNEQRKAKYKELHSVFKDLLHVVENITNGSSVSAACRKHHLSEKKFYKIISSNPITTCREDDLAVDILEIPGAFYDGYDDLYRIVFNIPKNVEYKRPLDYMETVDDVLETLTHDQKICIRNRFRLDGGEAITYAQISQTLGLTENQVQIIAHKALDKLRFPPRSYQLAYGNDIWYAMQAAEKAAHEREKAEIVRQIEEGKMTTPSCQVSILLADKNKEGYTEIEGLHGEGQEQDEAYIDQIGLSTRVYATLRRNGYRTIRQVCEASDDELRKCKGLGALGVKEIREKCNAYKKSQAPVTGSERTLDTGDGEDEELYEAGAVPIECLGLSGHAMNALKGARLITLRDLMTRTDQELLMVPNFSVYGLSEVRVACEHYTADHPAAAVPDNEDRSYPRITSSLRRLNSTQCQCLYFDVFGEAVTLPTDWENTIEYVFNVMLIKRERVLLSLYYNSLAYGVKAADKEVAAVLGTNTTLAHRAVEAIFRRLRQPLCKDILWNGVGAFLAGSGQ